MNIAQEVLLHLTSNLFLWLIIILAIINKIIEVKYSIYKIGNLRKSKLSIPLFFFLSFSINISSTLLV